MKTFLTRNIIVSFLVVVLIPSCEKTREQTTVGGVPSNGSFNPPVVPINPTNSSSCDAARPVIAATLVPIGRLSSARIRLQAAAAGNKILFIGGWHVGGNGWNDPVTVDIYNISNNSWSVHKLVPGNPQFTHFRFGAAIASLGNKIFVAGGGDAMGDNQSSAVDIYDAAADSWTRASLSSERQGVAAATVGSKVLFAGGFGYPDGFNWGEFETVDIYDNNTNAWSTAALSQARMDLVATTAGNKVYFAGGRGGSRMSNTIDIYDAATNVWSVAALRQPRTGMAAVATTDKIFWAGGASDYGSTGPANIDNAEILDLATGQATSACIMARSNFNAVQKNEYLVFFTGYQGGDADRFEIYNTTSGQWSTGLLNQQVRGASIISVNQTIYVAGGMVNGNYSSQVWRLEF